MCSECEGKAGQADAAPQGSMDLTCQEFCVRQSSPLPDDDTVGQLAFSLKEGREVQCAVLNQQSHEITCE